jgi:hypothetical protein
LKDFFRIITPGGGGCKLSGAQIEQFNEHLENNVYLRAKEICSFVRKTFKVKYTSKGMTSLLHQMGYTYKKPKQIPSKANIVKLMEFIEQYQLLKTEKAPDDHIYFTDAVHPLHNSQPAYGWIKKGAGNGDPSQYRSAAY